MSVLALILAGCNPSNTSKPKDVDFFIGLQGLTIGFLKNTPPQKIFEGDLFPVILNIKNNGAYSIKGNQAVISLGVEKDYTKKVTLLRGGRVSPLLDNSAIFGLGGKSPINPIGDEETISYNVEAGKVDPQSESHSSAVIATLCYPYETTLASSVCIDTDISNLRPGKKVCQNKDLIFNNGQGAPVAITKIEVNMLPVQSAQSPGDRIKPQFLIYIENKGQGTVIRSGAVRNFCTKSDISHEDLNVVYVDAELSNTKLNCQLEAKDKDPPGHIKLKDKKDIIWCDLKEGIPSSQDSYLSPLKIVLSYGYTQSISANYLIQKTAR